MREPIYIQRAVEPVDAVRLKAYAQLLGLENIVMDMHVTLAYSQDAVDWNAPVFEPIRQGMTIQSGTVESRKVEKFEGGAVVLNVPSDILSKRWAQLIMAGASWDHPEYKPHITLAYDDRFDADNVPHAFTAGIQMLPEEREWIHTEYGVGTA